MLIKEKSERNTLEMVSLEGLVPQDHLLRKIDCAVDFTHIYDFVEELYCADNYLLLPTLKHMTRSNGKNGAPQSEFQKRKYATYHGKRFTVGSVTIDPIFAVRFVVPYGFNQKTCNYTEEGRRLIHQRLTHLEVIFRYLAEHPLEHESIELNDNRISRVSAQKGKCAITKKQLTVYDMRVHKICPNGGNGYRNIDIVSKDAYELIHTKDTGRAKELIAKLISEGLWNEKALKKTNSYRVLVGNAIIE